MSATPSQLERNVHASCHLRAPFALLALAAALTTFADDGGNHALTIYSTAAPGAVAPDMTRNGGSGYSVPGYATVRHEREIALNAGRNTVRFADVAGLIDPTTVSFASLTDASGTRVMEQNFQFEPGQPGETAVALHRSRHRCGAGAR